MSRHQRRAAAGSQYSIILGLVAVVGLAALNLSGATISSMLGKTANSIALATNGGIGARPPNTTPQPVTFTPVTGAEVSTLTTSNTVTVQGIDGSVDVTVSGDGSPEVSINGAPFATSGTAANGNTLQLRLTSNAAFSTANTATVSIGTGSASWSVTTRAGDFTPDNFSFTATSGAALNTVITSNTITVAGFDGALTASVSGAGSPEISVNGGTFSGVPQSITAGQTLAVRLTSATTISTARVATVSIGGVNGTYSVTTTATSGPWTFNNCNTAGALGPDQTACNGAYASTSLAGAVTVSSGIQTWTVPTTGTYQIRVTGAAGGIYNTVSLGGGGRGARMRGNFALTSGTQLKILVGQMGNGGGGGGGTFVATTSNTPMIVAGGGGGLDGRYAAHADLDAKTGTAGGYGSVTSGTALNQAGGTGGDGATSCSAGNGGCGGGFYSNGSNVNNNGGYGFVQGGNGANNTTNYGGFGGGASTTDDQGAGAGGYSGGGGSPEDSSGGGGGSYNNGSSQVNEAGIGTGHGLVEISYVGP